MSCSKVYVNNVGTEVLVDAAQDISTAEILILHVKKPDNTEVEWTINEAHWPGIDDDHPNSQIKYIINVGDLDLIGSYKIQPYIDMPTWTGIGQTSSFKVWAKFK